MAPTALILRDAARAADTVREFERLGITSWCAGLINTIWPEDTRELASLTDALVAGEYDWLVLTSVNTVHVLEQLLAGRRFAPTLRLAAVGEKTASAATAQLGLRLSFQPQTQSAAGLIAQWQPEPGSTICYPHGNLASPTLSRGMARWPVKVTESTAYLTVEAGQEAGGTALLREADQLPAGIRVVAPAQLGGKLESMDLVVFSAPSIVRRFLALVDLPLPVSLRTLAIGQPTAAAMQEAGLIVDAIAATPTPAGLAAAAKDLLQRFGDPQR